MDIEQLKVKKDYWKEGQPSLPHTLPQWKKGERYIGYQTPWRLLIKVCHLSSRGKDLQVYEAMCFCASVNKKNPFKLEMVRVRDLGVSRSALYASLKRMEEAGLLKVERKPGQCPLIWLLDPDTNGTGQRQDDG